MNFQDFEGLQDGLLPMIFEIKFKGNRTYPFLLSHSMLIKGIFSLNSNEMIEHLRKEVDIHFEPGIENE
jgi:predicted metalloprotease